MKSFIRVLIFTVLLPFAVIFFLVVRKLSFKTRVKILTVLSHFLLMRTGRLDRLKRNVVFLRPDISDFELQQGIRHLVRTVARSWAALIGNEHVTPDDFKSRVEVENIDFLLRNAGFRKIVIAAAHVGSVDELLGVFPAYHLKVYVPTEAICPKWLLRFTIRMRSKFEGVTIEPVERGKTLQTCARHLAKGGLVALAIDIVRKGQRGVKCRIGRTSAVFPVGAVKLAIEEQALLIPALPYGSDSGKQKIVFLPPFELSHTGDAVHDVEENTRRFIEQIYVPHLIENWQYWTQILWSDFEEREDTANVGG